MGLIIGVASSPPRPKKAVCHDSNVAINGLELLTHALQLTLDLTEARGLAALQLVEFLISPDGYTKPEE